MARFGEILAELRQDRGLTQETLARVLFVTAGTISNYENSAHFPDIEKLTALADFSMCRWTICSGGAPPACRRVRWTNRVCRACRASRRGG